MYVHKRYGKLKMLTKNKTTKICIHVRIVWVNSLVIRQIFKSWEVHYILLKYKPIEIDKILKNKMYVFKN